MADALDELLAVLRLEPLGDDRFRGRGSSGDGAEGSFGGHLLGQATAAALACTAPDRMLHSLHGYFLRAGTPGEPYELVVERVRDGRSFSTRRVHTLQHGRTVFEALASLSSAAAGRTLDPAPPADFAELPPPESLPRYSELMASCDPVPFRADWALREHGIDKRVVNAPWAPRGPSAAGGIRLWIRANGEAPADPAVHAAMLAYQSDESLADCVLVPFGLTWSSPGTFFVSLDHALWLHRPVDLNDWLFVDQWPVAAAGERGVASGYVWSRSGELVASFTQEALMRIDEAGAP